MQNINSKLRLIFFVDIILLTFIFAILNYNKFGKMIPEGEYLILFLAYIFFWTSFSIYYDKYRIIIVKPFWIVLRIISWATLMCLLSIAITVSFTDLWSTSRIFILLVTLISFLSEIIFAVTIGIFQSSIYKNNIKDKMKELKN